MHPLSPNPIARRCAGLLLLLGAAARAQEPPPLPLQEFRGVWIATVDNIDWPSRKGLSTAAAQGELLAIVGDAAALRLNALVFQVRPCCDALYRSELEPWSEWLCGAQGQAPDPPWDPLQFLVEHAHALGLEVHAWCNPFRARHRAAHSPDADGHVLRRLPDACVRYGAYQWLDPGDDRAVEWSLRVIADIVARYDVDGVHLDDYFYPYPEQGQVFDDGRSYARYRQGGGKEVRADWRRHNIDSFVRRLYDNTHAQKPWVKVGISPFGIARPGLPKGIQAGVDQYEDMSADVVAWLQDGLCDYLAPQLYWPIDQRPQSFAVLLPWWNGQNARRRHLWPGLSASRALAGKPPWRRDELAQQIEMTRAQSTSPGHVLFSWKALRPGSPLRDRLDRTVYGEAAAVPASPWLGECEMPAAPRLLLDRSGGSARAIVSVDEAAKFWCAQVRLGSQWQTLAVRGRAASGVDLPAGCAEVAVRGIAANGLFGPVTVQDLHR